MTRMKWMATVTVLLGLLVTIARTAEGVLSAAGEFVSTASTVEQSQFASEERAAAREQEHERKCKAILSAAGIVPRGFAAASDRVDPVLLEVQLGEARALYATEPTYRSASTLAMLHAAAPSPVAAVRWARIAVTLAPDDAAAERCYDLLARFVAEADMGYEKVLRVASKGTDGVNNRHTRVEALTQLGRLVEAEQLARDTIALDRANAISWLNLAVVLRDLGQLDEARSAARTAKNLRGGTYAGADQVMATITCLSGHPDASMLKAAARIADPDWDPSCCD